MGNYVLMWNILGKQVSMMETWKNSQGSRLHNGDVEEFLRIKPPQWRREGVLDEQTFLMEDMSSYFKKLTEWGNGDFDNKSSMSIKRVENDEERTTNQQLNKSTQCQSTSANRSFSISFQKFQ